MPALNCIARLRSDVPDEGQAGVLPFLALRANLLEGRWERRGLLRGRPSRPLTAQRPAAGRQRPTPSSSSWCRTRPPGWRCVQRALQLLLQEDGQLQAVADAMQQLLRQRLGSADAFMALPAHAHGCQLARGAQTQSAEPLQGQQALLTWVGAARRTVLWRLRTWLWGCWPRKSSRGLSRCAALCLAACAMPHLPRAWLSTRWCCRRLSRPCSRSSPSPGIQAASTSRWACVL